MKIFLIGFMGCGKSLYGKELAKHMNFSFFDLDDYIGNKQKKTIAKIFEDEGELSFRVYERFALSEIIEKADNFILAVGGGTPCFYNNMDLINGAGLSVYLKCTADELYENIMQSNPNRPLLKNKRGTDLKAFISDLLLQRESYYLGAKIIVSSQNHLPEKLHKIIVENINN